MMNDDVKQDDTALDIEQQDSLSALDEVTENVETLDSNEISDVENAAQSDAASDYNDTNNPIDDAPNDDPQELIISDADTTPIQDDLIQESPAEEYITSTEDEVSESTSDFLSDENEEDSQVSDSADTLLEDGFTSTEETFEEMLEKSIKTIHTGQRVTGVVTSITSTEVSVDLGTKQSGYIPISEFTDDQNTDIDDMVKVGDTIESFVMRVNDVEGMVMLSKKRLDAIRNWTEIEAAKDNRTVVEGVVSEDNKGGVVVNIMGIRVFIPASQTGLPKSAAMTDLVKQTVRLVITEVNQSRRRVVGSIRAVQAEERREKAQRLWDDIEAGKQYDGVVKSMTSYGVFVDIGGVDGMIHISELSWTRIKQPSEVMAIGDEVTVYVLSFDKDNRKISLGYKKAEDNPWTKFTSQFSVGDITNVKIVKMMPFGAFAEICPGVDGLIHISQITDHRIGLPSEILSDGQLVDVKITEIDYDRNKVSLSIRALIAPGTLPMSDFEAAQASEDEDRSPVIVFDTDMPSQYVVDDSDDEESVIPNIDDVDETVTSSEELFSDEQSETPQDTEYPESQSIESFESENISEESHESIESEVNVEEFNELSEPEPLDEDTHESEETFDVDPDSEDTENTE
jgi:ribosomal protein S1